MELSLLKLRRLEKIIEAGDDAILEYMLDLEERLEKIIDKIPELEEREQVVNLTDDIKSEIAYLVEGLIDKDKLRGKDGDSYTLTDEDKRDIARQIKVPVVEKKTEKIIERIETPIYNTEIKEVAVADTAEDIRNKLELLTGEERLDKNAIRGLEDYDEVSRLAKTPRTGGAGGSTARNLYQLGDVNIQGITANQSIKWNGTQWVPYTPVTGYTVETPSGSVNSSNVTFTVTTIPVYIVADGITYFENAGFTRSSLTLTLDVPPSSYIRSFY